MNMETLGEILLPLAQALAGVSLDDPDQARVEIEELAPFKSDSIQAIRKAACEGANEGWLVPRENGGIRFGRIAKDIAGFSVDAVLMSSPGPRHRHPNGEIDLCFNTGGEAHFDGHPEGWVVYPPGSIHVPTVTDGEMVILYFLPGGSMEFM